MVRHIFTRPSVTTIFQQSGSLELYSEIDFRFGIYYIRCRHGYVYRLKNEYRKARHNRKDTSHEQWRNEKSLRKHYVNERYILTLSAEIKNSVENDVIGKLLGYEDYHSTEQQTITKENLYVSD